MTTKALMEKIDLQLLEMGIGKSKQITQLSYISGFPKSNFYAWRTGTEMKFSEAVHLCSKIGLNLSELLTTNPTTNGNE